MKKMYFAVLWLTLFAAGKGVAQITNIVGGNNTNISQVPWQVLLDVNGGLCGGSIIAPNWVVTACHCVEGLSANQVQVFAGITNQATERGIAQQPGVAQIIRHPGYNTNPNSRFDNDIALLRLNTPLNFNANVQPIAYATSNGNLTNVGTNALVSGWGRIIENGPVSDLLQSVNVNIIDNAIGGQQYDNLPSPDDRMNITGNMVIAGVQGVGGLDACNGDSGGPLMVSDNGNPVLVGIVSYGIGCARPNFMGVYTRVRNYCGWILQQMVDFASVAGPGNICDGSGSTYSIANQPFNTNVSWTSSNTWGVVVSSNGVATRQNNYSGPINIIANISNACGNATISRTAFVGPPQVGNIAVNGQTTSNPTVCINTYASIEALPFDANTSYNWSLNGSGNAFLTNYGGANTAFTSYVADCYELSVQVANACGSSQTSVTICAQNCFASYTAYPNPAKDQVTIEFEDVDRADALPDEIILLSEASTKAIKTVNVQDAFYRKALKNGHQVQIEVKDLPRGTYYLHIKNSRRKNKEVDSIRLLLE